AFATQKQEKYLARINRNFTNGIEEYKQGNIKLAEVLLFGAYTYAERNNLISFIEQATLQRVYRLISITQREQGHCDRALAITDKLQPESYRMNYNILMNYDYKLTDKGIIYRHMAKNAHDKGNIDLEKECYEKAFKLFQEAVNKNKDDRRA